MCPVFSLAVSVTLSLSLIAKSPVFSKASLSKIHGYPSTNCQWAVRKHKLPGQLMGYRDPSVHHVRVNLPVTRKLENSTSSVLNAIVMDRAVLTDSGSK